MPTSVEPRIEHVVVLMLENRSFDHLLGFLSHTDPSFNGLQAGFHNVSSAGVSIPVTREGDPGDAAPDHSHAGVLLQLSGFGDIAAMGGFVRSYESLSGDPSSAAKVMGCLDPYRHAPVLAHLAEQFAVCDSWFSSVPGETWPNRNFAHAATSDGASNIELGLYYDRTIFEQLASVGASWRIYHDGQAQAWCFPNLWRTNLSWWDKVRGRTETLPNWFEQDEFPAHAKAGDLPSYAFIEPTHMAEVGEPRETNSQHPDNNHHDSADFQAGEQLIKEVYEALISNPPLFEKTLLLITYDEHGGFVDHVPPPQATPPGGKVFRSWSRRLGILGRGLLARLQGKVPPITDTFAFDRLGVRVPAVLVSPWIEAGTVVHTQFEHASIPATLRALFAPRLPALSARDAMANTFHEIVRTCGLTTPRSLTPLGISSPLATAGPLGVIPAQPLGIGAAATSGKGPRSKFDWQLAHLGQRVHHELARKLATTRPVRGAPPAVVSVAGLVEAARPALSAEASPTWVGDAFAEAARAARREHRTLPPR
jgi:phospholipase C